MMQPSGLGNAFPTLSDFDFERIGRSSTEVIGQPVGIGTYSDHPACPLSFLFPNWRIKVYLHLIYFSRTAIVSS
jgi:hypothetical protein